MEDTVENKRLEFCHQFTKYLLALSNKREEFNAGGKTKTEDGFVTQLAEGAGEAIGMATGASLSVVTPSSSKYGLLARPILKNLGKGGGKLYEAHERSKLRDDNRIIIASFPQEYDARRKCIDVFIQASLAIFNSYECQFANVKTEQGYWKLAMSKLAEDAGERVINCVKELNFEEQKEFNYALRLSDPTLLYNAILFGKSTESKLKTLTGKPGHTLVYNYSRLKGGKQKTIVMRSSKLYDSIGYTLKDEYRVKKFLKDDNTWNAEYGYRRLHPFDKFYDENKFKYTEYIVSRSQSEVQNSFCFYNYTLPIEEDADVQNIVEQIKKNIQRTDPNFNNMLSDMVEIVEEIPNSLKEIKSEVKDGFHKLEASVDHLSTVISANTNQAEVSEEIANSLTQMKMGLDELATSLAIKNKPDLPQEITYGNPKNVKYFVERNLVGTTESSTNSRIFVFYGQAGSGKTEEAIHTAFAQRSLSLTDIIFLSCGSLGSMQEQLINFAAIYKLDVGTDRTLIFETIVLKLSGRSIVFILDNVDDENIVQCISNRIPESHKILITTQLKELSKRDDLRMVPVGEFSEDETKEFYMSHLSPTFIADTAELVNLVKEVGRIPIFVQMSCAFLNQEIEDNPNYTISQFLTDLKNKEELTNDYFSGELDAGKSLIPRGSSIKIWEMVLEKIKSKKRIGEVGLEFLSVLAYIQPHDIHTEFVTQVLGYKTGRRDVMKALRLLDKYLICKFSENRKNVSIHRMVQGTIRRIDTYKETTLEKLLHYFLSNNVFSRQEVGFYWFPHFHPVFHFIISRKNLAQRFENEMTRLWNIPEYHYEFDKVFELEVMVHALDNLGNVTNNWLTPFLRRHNFPLNESPNTKSVEWKYDMYTTIYESLVKLRGKADLYTIKFSLLRANAYYNFNCDMGIEMYKDAYALALQLVSTNFSSDDLAIAHSLSYLVPSIELPLIPVMMIYFTYLIPIQLLNSLFCDSERLDFILKELSLYYYEISFMDRSVRMSKPCVEAARIYLLENNLNTGVILDILNRFLRFMETNAFKSTYLPYLENVLSCIDDFSDKNLMKIFKRIAEFAIRNHYLEFAKRIIISSEKQSLDKEIFENLKTQVENETRSYNETVELLNTLFTQICESNNSNSENESLNYDLGPDFQQFLEQSEIPNDDRIPEKGRQVLAYIAHKLFLTFPLEIIAHLDVGVGYVYEMGRIVKACVEIESESIGEMHKELGRYSWLQSWRWQSQLQHVHLVKESGRTIYTTYFPYTNTHATLAYSFMMMQIRRELIQRGKSPNILKIILRGLNSLCKTDGFMQDKNMFYVTLFRRIWRQILQLSQNDSKPILEDFSDLLYFSMSVYFGVTFGEKPNYINDDFINLLREKLEFRIKKDIRH